MSYQNITKNGVDRAAPLTFDRPARQDLTITIKARVDGFDTEVCYTGSIDQLLAVTKRLRELGAEPALVAGGHQLPTPAARKPAQQVEPIYQPDGTACCPVHLRPLQPGQYGLFCSAKAKPGEAANAKGYCNIRFSE